MVPLASPGSSIRRRARFLDAHLWVTPYAADERFPAGEFPNQGPEEDGLPKWIKGDRSLLNADLVLWHVFGVTHIVRLEDWPVMPVEHCGFRLVPVGFCDANPAIDLPPPICQSKL